MSKTLLDYIQRVRLHLMEVENSVEIADYDIVAAIKSAASYHSTFKSYKRVLDLTAPTAGAYDKAVPSTWDNALSSIVSIEYPIGSQTPQILDADDYMLYQSPTGVVIRFTGSVPTASFRLTFYSPHVISDTEITFTDNEFEGISCLCSAIAARALGTRYLRAWSDNIASDIMQWNNKAEQYFSLARQLETLWRISMGIGEGGANGKGSTYGPALAINSWPSSFSDSGRLIAHPEHRD